MSADDPKAYRWDGKVWHELEKFALGGPEIQNYAHETRPTLDEINRVAIAKIMPGLVDSFFRRSPILAYLRQGSFDARFVTGHVLPPRHR